MGLASAIRNDRADARNAKKQTLRTVVGRGLATYACGHPSVLKAYFKTRLFRTAIQTHIAGTVADVKTVLKLSAVNGGGRKHGSSL